MMASDLRRPRRRDEVRIRRAGSETTAYDPSSSAIHLLNPSALAIWELCDGETTPYEIAEAVSEVTGRPIDEVEAEVEQAVTALEELGLITL